MRKSIVRIFLCLVALILANVSMTAQDKPFNVSGSVLDEAGYPVIGAAVLIKGERTGVISDVDGKYKMCHIQKPLLRFPALATLHRPSRWPDGISWTLSLSRMSRRLARLSW